MSELRARRDAARDADLIELRLDHVVDPDVDGALAGRRQPVVVTCRPTWEGGRFRGAKKSGGGSWSAPWSWAPISWTSSGGPASMT